MAVTSPSFEPQTDTSLSVLPPRPSLEQLRKRARDLLAAVRAGDPTAQARLQRWFPAPAPGGEASAPPRLAQAQLVIAREHGCASWIKLRREVELGPLRAQLERYSQRGWEVWRDVNLVLAAAGADGVQVALEGLKHADPRVRFGVVGFLDHFMTEACVPYLAELALHDPDAEVRRAAVHALVCERCKEEPPETDPLPILLHALLHDVNRRVRFNAVLPLRRHPQYPDIPQVQAAFRHALRHDSSWMVRYAVVGAVRGDDTLPLLADVAQQDSDSLVRVAAASRLGRESSFLGVACQVLERVLAGEATESTVRARRDAHRALVRLSSAYRQLSVQRAREASLARSRP